MYGTATVKYIVPNLFLSRKTPLLYLRNSSVKYIINHTASFENIKNKQETNKTVKLFTFVFGRSISLKLCELVWNYVSYYCRSGYLIKIFANVWFWDFSRSLEFENFHFSLVALL